MPRKKANMIILEAHNQLRVFEISHAERILRMKNNGGWKLPEDSKFEFSKENGIKYKRNKRASKKP